MNGREQTDAWSLVSGDVALDFVNTVGGNESTADLDAVATYDLLLVWSVRAGTVDQHQADRLLRRSRRRVDEADEVMERARALRASLYEVFDRMHAGQPITTSWTAVRPAVAAAVAAAQPVALETGTVWSWAGVSDLDAPLHPVAHAAATLVTDPRIDLLRQCDRCTWLFLDQSRNHARRWCDMRTCGVAEKVERQAERRSRGSRGA